MHQLHQCKRCTGANEECELFRRNRFYLEHNVAVENPFKIAIIGLNRMFKDMSLYRIMLANN